MFSAIFTLSSVSLKAQVKITDGAGLTMDANSILELESTNKGLLIPRVTLTSLSTVAPLTGTVPVGMLVYSTGGTISPGFYYWNGTLWVRLVASADPPKNFNIVTKTLNATLLKTENLVFASGDITLTLPTVTIADNGLEITIKNTGTFTDLITVSPEAGKKIDANTSSWLTRWHGRTFIASGSNWIIKGKEIQTDNELEVSAIGSFTTISEVVAFLGAHMNGPTVVNLGAGTYPIAATQTINLSYPVTFQGISFSETTIAATAGTPLFSCTSECSFKMIKFKAFSNAPGNDAIRYTGAGIHHEVKDCRFSGFNKGIVSTTNNDLWIFENDFQGCAGAAIEIAAGSAIGGRLRITETDFFQCKIGVNLLSGKADTVSILNSTFYNTASDIGIQYTPATFTSFAAMFITNTAWNNQGTYMSGFDFTRSDGRDANSFIQNNSGMEDKRPNCKISVINNTATTTITNSGTYYKANWTNTSSSTCKFTIANNLITYQPVNKMDIYMVISGNLSVDKSDRTISFGICKNGDSAVRYGESTMRTPTKTVNDSYQFSTVVFLSNVSPGNYFEFFVNSSSNGDNITVQDINWFVNSQ